MDRRLICPECGGRNKAGAKHCKYCGAELRLGMEAPSRGMPLALPLAMAAVFLTLLATYGYLWLGGPLPTSLKEVLKETMVVTREFPVTRIVRVPVTSTIPTPKVVKEIVEITVPVTRIVTRKVLVTPTPTSTPTPAPTPIAEAPEIEWERTLGDSDYDEAFSVQQTSDGGYIVAGGTESYGAGGGDFWLIKVRGG